MVIYIICKGGCPTASMTRWRPRWRRKLCGSEQQCLRFLHQLIALIQERVNHTQRNHGPALPAGRTLLERVGSCRDLAVVMIECSRAIGHLHALSAVTTSHCHNQLTMTSMPGRGYLPGLVGVALTPADREQ